MDIKRFHIIRALWFSLKGFKACWGEVAFRQECYLSIVTIPLACILGQTPIAKALMIGSWLMVLVMEVINTAIEAVVDLVSPDHHELAAVAKDCGSAAVLGAIIVAVGVWGFLLLTH